MFSKRRVGSFLTFQPSGLRVPCDGARSVLEIALAQGVTLTHSCGGMGSCGTCLVRVESDLASLPGREEIESEMAQDRGFEPHERLACQLVGFDGLVIRLRDDEGEDEPHST